MEQLFHDWNFEDNFHMSTNKRSIRPEDELVELLWRDGQVVLQSQARREQPSLQIQTPRKPNNTLLDTQETQQKPNNNNNNHTVLLDQDQETVSWIQYPPEDVVDPFESEFSSSHFFSPIDHINVPNRPDKTKPVQESVKHETMAPPKFRSSVITVGPSHCGSNQSMNDHNTLTDPQVTCVRSKKVVDEEERLVLETSNSGGSSGCSYGKSNKETGSRRSVTIDRKRKHVMDTDQESVSQSDVRLMSTDDQDQATGNNNNNNNNKSSQRSGSTRRSRAAEVHNLSERRRRDRINERMKALQELIPHCSKTDKASILDEAIDYLKSLQMQLQVMWMGSGMAAAAAAAATTPMMFPGVQPPPPPYINQMSMPSQMQLPQFPVMNRSVTQNHPGLVCRNPVQLQMQAQNQMLSDQLARYMGGFPQTTNTQTQTVQQQPMDMLRFGSPLGQQSQPLPPVNTESLRMGKLG